MSKHTSGTNLPTDSPDATIQAGKGAKEDEQTETDELDELAKRAKMSFDGKHWKFGEETKAALEAWSRKQTVGVLDGLLKKQLEGYPILRGTGKYRVVPVSAIEAARARVREGQ